MVVFWPERPGLPSGAGYRGHEVAAVTRVKGRREAGDGSRGRGRGRSGSPTNEGREGDCQRQTANCKLEAPQSGAEGSDMAELYPFSSRTAELLAEPPAAGNTHRWLAQAACGLCRVLPAERCAAFLRRCCEVHVTHRWVPEREIQAAVGFAYGREVGRWAVGSWKWQNAEETEVPPSTCRRFSPWHRARSWAPGCRGRPASGCWRGRGWRPMTAGIMRASSSFSRSTGSG